MGQIFSLTAKEARKIMDAAVQTLETQFIAASVCLVNRDGTIIVSLMMDGVRPHTANVARLKAQQSALTGKSTLDIRDEIAAGKKTAEILGIPANELICWAGGMPIYDKEGNLLGGIGVSEPGEMTEEMVAENAVCKAGFDVKK